ncbi:MAG: UDP-N-acetylmuramoyl-L-alanine--D-glutamate ligase [Pseudomonadota bacterium]|uniref:UDP-N-acetylmuramoyl-L-alanine--D-glutamate ligase n=1 Tax=Thermithiobacillus tepidarius TaxID=929 RepID=UPI00041FB083|nr:UDP-N-acetylmuramoyl-L-alanine--D-glutamate ligase [Thermithiobacillus tepidarius]
MRELRNQNVLVVGLGKTGQSVLPVLLRLGARVQAADSRAAPPGLDALRERYPAVQWYLGPFEPALFAAQDLIVASPGLAQSDPAFAQARAVGVPVIGDIELFAWLAKAPVVGITGSNGKSTVTTLVGEMAQKAGLRAGVGGNLGTPALDLLPADGGEPDLYILELSSFQLELVDSFRPRVAAVLNLSEDHMDRYNGFADYVAAKARIFARMGAGDTLVLNANDAPTRALAAQVPAGVDLVYFGRQAPHGLGHVRVLDEGFGEQLCIDGAAGTTQMVLPLSALRMVGEHNVENAMAALAIAFAAGIPAAAAAAALREFAGLPHRMIRVTELNGVTYYNDSKGTNVGATLKALSGLPGPVVAILGGDCKGADFTPLRAAVVAQARAVVLLGRDAPRLEAALAGLVPMRHARSMEEAVQLAAELAKPGDQVLLSPACASLDMFQDYAERGRVFTEAVLRLANGRQAWSS